MKIVHLIYTGAVAGAEKYLVNLLPGLKKYKIECHLICVCPVSSISIIAAYCERMNEQGVTTILMQGGKKDFLSIAKAINNYLNKESISIVHSHLSNADLLAVLTKIICTKKLFIISSKHGYDERYLVKYESEARAHTIDRNLYYYLTKFLLRNIDVNLATSKGIADLYYNIKLASKPYQYIHHGIYPIPSVASTVEDNSKFKLIIVGRLELVKGHKFLFEALPKVLKEFPQTQLLILGNGSEKANLIKKATDLGIYGNINFIGYKDNVYQYISESDIIIQPSLFESFGLVYIEAFALQVPVIAFDTPAANEIITNNETGVLVPKFDSNELAERIIFLLQNHGERKRIAGNAYEKFLQYYTADTMIAKTAAWYRSLFPHPE